jgi:hypothetical protein
MNLDKIIELDGKPRRSEQARANIKQATERKRGC